MTISSRSKRSSFLVVLAGSLAAACGSSNAPGGDEWTGSGSQAVVCEGVGIHPASCGGYVPPPVQHPAAPTRPTTLPAVTGCTAGTWCDFTDFTGGGGQFVGTLCMYEYYQVIEVTATASSSYSVTYCTTAGVGASELMTWQVNNPGSSTSATSPGLQTAATGQTWLTFDMSTGPVFPMPASPVPCEAGHKCSFDKPDSLVLDDLGCSVAYVFEKTLLDGSVDPNETDGLNGAWVAMCPTSADTTGWANAGTNKYRGAFTTLRFEGLPTLTTDSGFTYLVYGTPGVGLSCSECIIYDPGGSGGGTGSSGGSGGGAQQD